MTKLHTFEEVMEKINELTKNKIFQKGIIHSYELKRLFSENLSFVEDIDNMLSGYHDIYGFYYVKIKGGYAMFPLDKEEVIRVNWIEKMDEGWLKILSKTFADYEKAEERLKTAKSQIHEIMESQKLRMLFQK